MRNYFPLLDKKKELFLTSQIYLDPPITLALLKTDKRQRETKTSSTFSVDRFGLDLLKEKIQRQTAKDFRILREAYSPPFLLLPGCRVKQYILTFIFYPVKIPEIDPEPP